MTNPEVIAHRGMPRVATENTLPSFEAALAAGADGIELDVHATADGVVVVHHDPTIATSDRSGARGEVAIAELRAEQLAAHDGGRDIPTLGDVLALVDGRGVVYVEIKAAHIEERVLGEIGRHRTPCAVHSFDHRAPQRVHRLAPAIPVGILLTSYLVDPVAALRATGARDLWQRWELIDEPLVQRVHDDGGRVVAWTVNSLAAVDRLAAIGVDALCTDVADEVRRHLSPRG